MLQFCAFGYVQALYAFVAADVKVGELRIFAQNERRIIRFAAHKVVVVELKGCERRQVHRIEVRQVAVADVD